MKLLKQYCLLFIFMCTAIAAAGDVTVSLNGINPLTINIKGTSTNQEAGSISIYLYFRDDETTDLLIGDVNAGQLESTWGWGTSFRSQSIQSGGWSKGGYTFTRRLYYDNVDLGDQNDYWTTEGINAIVCTFTTVGSGHVFIEVNGSDGLADWSGTAHNVLYANQDKTLPVELTSFTAVPVTEGIQVNWATESEDNNLGFVLERKTKLESDFSIIASYKTNPGLAGKGTVATHNDYFFIDNSIFSGDICIYRLSDVNSCGVKSCLGTIQAIAISEKLPDKTDLLPAWPNPFNPVTNIKYSLATDGNVNLVVYDIMGRVVTTLLQEKQQAGQYTCIWSGTTDGGGAAPSGVYFILLRTENLSRSQKVVLVK